MIPQSFIDQHKPGGFTMFGIPIEKLSKEELMASLVFMGKEYTNSVTSHTRSMNLLNDLIKQRVGLVYNKSIDVDQKNSR